MLHRARRFCSLHTRRLAGLISTAATPDLRDLYGQAARQNARTRNPVIVIPGVMGSRLIVPGRTIPIWGGDKRSDFVDHHDPIQARLFAHEMEMGTPLHLLTDDVEPDGSIYRLRAHRFGLSVQVKAYENIMRTLGAAGYQDAQTRSVRYGLDYGHDALAKCFEFDYDWRRSLPENAVRLGEMVEAVLRFAKREAGGREDLKVDIVAHSMGGLLLRYYLRYGKRLLPRDDEPIEPTWAGA
jgi:hypothetical protein